MLILIGSLSFFLKIVNFLGSFQDFFLVLLSFLESLRFFEGLLRPVVGVKKTNLKSSKLTFRPYEKCHFRIFLG
jgi:hypothetical protein